MGIKSDLVGQRFGYLTVIEKTRQTQDKYTLWRCQCQCGREIYANTKRLKRGTVTNCGCVPKTSAANGPIAEDLTGRCFGSLTVLNRAPSQKGRTRWVCQCECGRKKEIASHELKAGRTKSCGCKKHERGKWGADIKNQRFGRLTALYPTNNRDKKYSVYWHCHCDCGNELEVTQDNLVYGNYKSCGCLKKEVQRKIAEQLHMVDGTCVEWLEKRKKRCDNTSGFRGVHQLKNGKYRVGIGFKGKQFHVGTYRTLDEAIEARLEIEEHIHEAFLKSYYKWKKKAEANPQWGQEHALIFEVEKMKGKFVITNKVIFAGAAKNSMQILLPMI